MPTLPTVEVTQAQADRILAAYKAKYGTITTAETVAAYRREVIEMVKGTVITYEMQLIQERQSAERQAEIDAVMAGLPETPPLPVEPPPDPTIDPTEIV